MNQHHQRRLKDAQGLSFLHQFGWLRTCELGKLMWPDIVSSRQSADRLARDWLARRLVIARDLPDAAGRALVLAAAGVRLLAEHGVLATTGKDIGKLTEQGWLPPMTWRHDLLAVGILCELHRQGFRVHPEAELRRHGDQGAKIPDGVAVKGAQVLFVEVENARKTGPEMRKLASAVSLAAIGGAPMVASFKATAALVGFVPGALDERGYVISHQERVRRAVEIAAPADFDLHWAECKLLGPAGVGEVRFTSERIKSNRAAAVLLRLDGYGWHTHEDGSVWSSYGEYNVFVWESDAHQWGYSVETKAGAVVGGGHADTIAEAKEAGAAWLTRSCP